MGLFSKIKNKFTSKNANKKYDVGLSKSRDEFSSRVAELQKRYRTLDDDFFDELEELLITYDVGVQMVMDIVESIKEEVKEQRIQDPKLINEIIIDQMFMAYAGNDDVDTSLNIKDGRTNIVLITGVNGAGKTTSIAKITNRLVKENKKVLLVAGDTFRAGAVEQLSIWADRLGVDIVKPTKQGQDPSSVIFEGVEKASKENYDVVICDTAGRLQNKTNLMRELDKIYKVIKRHFPDAPHENLLVIDATTGQNGVSQAEKFNEVSEVSGIVLTKMDGTSKGGIILAIKEKIGIPVKLIGLGEKIEDLQDFDLDEYIYNLTKGLSNGND